jgi:23S rRNA (cytosine1962-C5)-methyltransferase
MVQIKGKVFLKRGKEQSAKRFHPWIFSGAIHSKTTGIADGDWVEVCDAENSVIGYGHYQQATISVRILQFGNIPPSENFYLLKFKNAFLLRKNLFSNTSKTDCFRLIHGEGDSLPGLIIDWYNGAAVVQAHSWGMHADRQDIAVALQNLFKDEVKAIYYKSQTTIGSGKNTIEDEYLFGMAAQPHGVIENGNHFLIDWETGQKTGFFLDQRDNRKLLGEYAKGKSVLNTFCYSGGFSVYALTQGASLVHSVDASAKAIELTRQNIKANGFSETDHGCYAIDTFQFLKDSQQQYDIVVIDPPAFAKHRDAKHQALKGYQRLNAAALEKVKSGGLLFTFSCSQVVDRDLFYGAVTAASIQVRREVRVLHHVRQPADHPVSIFHPEGEYLKGLVLYVS